MGLCAECPDAGRCGSALVVGVGDLQMTPDKADNDPGAGQAPCADEPRSGQKKDG